MDVYKQILNEIRKKVIMNFQNIKGEKSYIFEDPQDYEKRFLAMGFQGMRGKKNNFPLEWEKRAAMGFQGMRGKKSLFDEIEELEKRASFQVSGSLLFRKEVKIIFLMYF